MGFPYKCCLQLPVTTAVTAERFRMWDIRYQRAPEICKIKHGLKHYNDFIKDLAPTGVKPGLSPAG
jgi:hypothetical protein